MPATFWYEKNSHTVVRWKQVDCRFLSCLGLSFRDVIISTIVCSWTLNCASWYSNCCVICACWTSRSCEDLPLRSLISCDLWLGNVCFASHSFNSPFKKLVHPFKIGCFCTKNKRVTCVANSYHFHQCTWNYQSLNLANNLQFFPRIAENSDFTSSRFPVEKSGFSFHHSRKTRTLWKMGFLEIKCLSHISPWLRNSTHRFSLTTLVSSFVLKKNTNWKIVSIDFSLQIPCIARDDRFHLFGETWLLPSSIAPFSHTFRRDLRKAWNFCSVHFSDNFSVEKGRFCLTTLLFFTTFWHEKSNLKKFPSAFWR